MNSVIANVSFLIQVEQFTRELCLWTRAHTFKNIKIEQYECRISTTAIDLSTRTIVNPKQKASDSMWSTACSVINLFKEEKAPFIWPVGQAGVDMSIALPSHRYLSTLYLFSQSGQLRIPVLKSLVWRHCDLNSLCSIRWPVSWPLCHQCDESSPRNL